MKNAKIVAFLLIVLCGSAFAGGKFLLAPDGRHIAVNNGEARAIKEAMKIRELQADKDSQWSSAQTEYEVRWADGGGPVNFGFGTGDSMAQYMVPLTSATVKSVWIQSSDYCGSFEVLLHESLYAGEVVSGACANAAGWLGHYVDGVWVAGTNECFNTPLLGAEIWPAMGIGGVPIEFEAVTHDGEWRTLDLGTLGYPTVTGPFIIDAATTLSDPDNCWGIGAVDGPLTPFHAFKYYLEDGTSGNPGWHIRTYGWNVYAMVEYLADIPPFIVDPTVLFTTLSLDARTVSATITDVNPIGGAEGVAEALLHYSFNEGDTVSVAMTAVVDTFSAEIPGGVPGDDITYFITATDVLGLDAKSASTTYSIFAPSEPNLIVNNGGFSDGTVAYYYPYGFEGEFNFDIWDVGNNGKATLALLENYETVVEVSGGGPNSVTDSTGLMTWLDGGNVNFFTGGDEWLGGYYGYPADMDLVSGVHFPNDYLGLSWYSADVNYAASPDQGGISRLLTVADDAISGDLHAFLADSLDLNYDPNYEIGADNWLDAVDAVDGATISYNLVTGILDSEGATDPEADTLATGVYMEHANGNKTAFFGFDVLSLNTQPSYHWIGIYPEGPLQQSLDWFGFGVAVDDEVRIPNKFSLHQNYPNPFNPVTTINYDLPYDGQVTLTIYNMLGQKVTTLVNEFGRVGNHTVTWNGTNDLGSSVATGIYLYKIDAGDFSATKKMILMK